MRIAKKQHRLVDKKLKKIKRTMQCLERYYSLKKEADQKVKRNDGHEQEELKDSPVSKAEQQQEPKGDATSRHRSKRKKVNILTCAATVSLVKTAAGMNIEVDKGSDDKILERWNMLTTGGNKLKSRRW